MSTRLLSVDDSKTIRLIIAKAFRPFDCVMFEAANGAEALEVAAKEKPHLIILDLTMPVMDGYETLKRLRADPVLKDIPVVMLTAEAGRENVLRIAQLGVQGYVIKPFDEAKIIERVGKVAPLKPKPEVIVKPRKSDDPVSLLIVDDKPAIVDNIKAGLGTTPWKVTAVATEAEALDALEKRHFDIICASLSLPQDAAFTLFRALRSNARLREVPFLGMAPKTAAELQARAQQLGVNGIVTKPIAGEEFKAVICRTLNLDTSSQFFRQRGGALVVTIPGECSPKDAVFVLSSIEAKTNEAVDAGLDRMILDLSAVQTADFSHIKLVMETMQLSQKAGLKCGLVGSAVVIAECRNFEETRGLPFASNYDEALARLSAG